MTKVKIGLFRFGTLYTRNQMKEDMLNGLMTIHLNGAKESQWDSISYATKYVEEHGRCEIWKRGNKRQYEKQLDEEIKDIEDEMKEEMEDPKKKFLIGKSFLF